MEGIVAVRGKWACACRSPFLFTLSRCLFSLFRLGLQASGPNSTVGASRG